MGEDIETIFILLISNITFIILFLLSQRQVRMSNDLNNRLCLLIDLYKHEAEMNRATIARFNMINGGCKDDKVI